LGRQVGTRTHEVGTRKAKKGNRGVLKCTMSKIPKVQKGIDASLLKTVEEVRRGDIEGLAYLAKFWEEFKEDQPHLHNLIIKEMNQFESKKIMAAFAHGVWMAYAALQSQEEADEMNQDWGI
jgi:hypothetical protein